MPTANKISTLRKGGDSGNICNPPCSKCFTAKNSNFLIFNSVISKFHTQKKA